MPQGIEFVEPWQRMCWIASLHRTSFLGCKRFATSSWNNAKMADGISRLIWRFFCWPCSMCRLVWRWWRTRVPWTVHHSTTNHTNFNHNNSWNTTHNNSEDNIDHNLMDRRLRRCLLQRMVELSGKLQLWRLCLSVKLWTRSLRVSHNLRRWKRNNRSNGNCKSQLVCSNKFYIFLTRKL